VDIVRISRQIAYVVVGIVAAWALTACSGSDTSDASKATASKSPTSQSSQAAQPTTSSVPAGIVLSTCNSGADGTRNIEFVNPDNGDVAETRFFVIEPMTFESIGDCNSNLSGAKMRSAFNDGFTSIAAQQPLPENGYHTGVVNASQSLQDTTTDFVDLGGAQDNGFSSATQQSVGAFGPDGRLYFVQGTQGQGKLMAVNPTGGQPQAVPASDDVKNIDPADATDRVFFLPNDKDLQFNTDLQEVVAPDDSWAIWAGDGWIGYGKPGTPGTQTEPNYGHTLWPFGYINQMSFYGSTDDTLVHATITRSTVKEQSLLPNTDGKIIDPTLSPDGKQIAFILEKETSRALFVVSTDGGQPTKVIDIDRAKLGVAILDWTAGK
jgi:WD40-like Beta Propeller Repeat